MKETWNADSSEKRKKKTPALCYKQPFKQQTTGENEREIAWYGRRILNVVSIEQN